MSVDYVSCEFCQGTMVTEMICGDFECRKLDKERCDNCLKDKDGDQGLGPCEFKSFYDK